MKVEITARDSAFLREECPDNYELEQKENILLLEVPDSTEEFLKFIEPLGRFSIDLDRDFEGNLKKSGRLINLHFENDYD